MRRAKEEVKIGFIEKKGDERDETKEKRRKFKERMECKITQ